MDASERAGAAPGRPVAVGGRGRRGSRVHEHEVQVGEEEKRDEGAAMLTFLTGESADSTHARSHRRKSQEGESVRKNVNGPANRVGAKDQGGGSGKGKEKAVDSDDDGVVDTGNRFQGSEGCRTGDCQLTGGGDSSIKKGRAGGTSRGRRARPMGRRLGCADTTEMSVFDVFSSDNEDEDEDKVSKEQPHALRRARAGTGADKLPVERKEGRGIEQGREQELNGVGMGGSESVLPTAESHVLPTAASLVAECAAAAVRMDESEEGASTRGGARGTVSRRTRRQRTFEQQLEAASEASSICTQLANSNGPLPRPQAACDAAPADADEGGADAVHVAPVDNERSNGAVGRDEGGSPGPRKGSVVAGCEGSDRQDQRAGDKAPAAASSSIAVAKTAVSDGGHCDIASAPHALPKDE